MVRQESGRVPLKLLEAKASHPNTVMEAQDAGKAPSSSLSPRPRYSTYISARLDQVGRDTKLYMESNMTAQHPEIQSQTQT